MFIERKTHNNYRLICKHSCHVLKYGNQGIKVSSFGRLTNVQINSLNRCVLKIIRKFKNKKSIKLWNLVLLNFNLTKLSSESRMGKGKGAVFSKAVFIRPGNIIFEFEGVSLQQTLLILSSLKKLSHLKLSIVKK
uniref:Ribosomal protein L16 n=1 Tax=Betaphycus gelatinus TaxID=1191690 RepID=A0A2H4QI51_9FLOR|nr:ribosomal protein L16 [Betaphycus gelatinus]ATX68843.1 ribosomal protein L16 [Betaphycus gelatinus]